MEAENTGENSGNTQGTLPTMTLQSSDFHVTISQKENCGRFLRRREQFQEDSQICV